MLHIKCMSAAVRPKSGTCDQTSTKSRTQMCIKEHVIWNKNKDVIVFCMGIVLFVVTLYIQSEHCVVTVLCCVCRPGWLWLPQGPPLVAGYDNE